MAVKLSKSLKDNQGASGVASTVSEYERRFERDQHDVAQISDAATVNNLYYDVVTEFFEFGWGRSFHFAPRVPGESFKASLARHEHLLAHKLGLTPGMVVADLGCGVGGPLIEIARFTGAKIVGVNSNAYQLERARKLTDEAELSHLAEFLHGDFLNVDAPDASFDAAYSIEATCCAPDKVSVYREVFRLLKPGARFAAYEYCMTDRFDAQNPQHVRIKADLQLGGGLLIIDDMPTVDNALRSVGFEVLETRDLTQQTGPSIPWFEPLVGSGIFLAAFRSSRIGRWVTQNSVRALETLRIAPKGAARVAEMLNLCATAMVEAGRLGIFTPMYLVHARKPG
ncbi:MAG: sterol 24-C-methyltransferase family protein [Chloroflexota bacterium]|nr:sterol 24-C-methyltransferase family protein [Chloroflexota bacterium]